MEHSRWLDLKGIRSESAWMLEAIIAPQCGEIAGSSNTWPDKSKASCHRSGGASLFMPRSANSFRKTAPGNLARSAGAVTPISWHGQKGPRIIFSPLDERLPDVAPSRRHLNKDATVSFGENLDPAIAG
jgi:hypothetical protein